jgi:hypothetical protein
MYKYTRLYDTPKDGLLEIFISKAPISREEIVFVVHLDVVDVDTLSMWRDSVKSSSTSRDVYASGLRELAEFRL